MNESNNEERERNTPTREHTQETQVHCYGSRWRSRTFFSSSLFSSASCAARRSRSILVLLFRFG